MKTKKNVDMNSQLTYIRWNRACQYDGKCVEHYTKQMFNKGLYK